MSIEVPCAPTSPFVPLAPATSDGSPFGPTTSEGSPLGPTWVDGSPLGPTSPFGPTTSDGSPLGPSGPIALDGSPLIPVSPFVPWSPFAPGLAPIHILYLTVSTKVKVAPVKSVRSQSIKPFWLPLCAEVAVTVYAAVPPAPAKSSIVTIVPSWAKAICTPIGSVSRTLKDGMPLPVAAVVVGAGALMLNWPVVTVVFPLGLSV